VSSTAPVVIDARAASREQIGGVERVTIEMAARLPALRPGRYRVLQPPRLLAHKAGHAWEQAVLPLAARGAEVLYCPANLAPVASRRCAVLIHDVAALRHPEWYGTAYARYQRLLLPLLARRARLVLTVSEFSRGEIVAELAVAPEKVAVVPNGVDERFSPGADPEPARRRLGLERPYVLAVGTRIARKNLGAMSAAARAAASAGLELVSVGSGRGYMRPEAGVPLRALGYVPDELLPGLYAGARALAMPSLYEGFGLPCLEAMACGTPVVAADRGALPEVCGDAALLVDPADEPALAAAVLAAATDEDLRSRLAAGGLERARRFSWARSAELTDRAIGGLLRG
jgi:glycosyltransferase involved in cell wall biosynthesis